jgi:putative intracellular protease/amidase
MGSGRSEMVRAIFGIDPIDGGEIFVKGKKCTIYPGMQEELKKGGGRPVDDLVVVDGNVVTSQGPATSMLFALEIVTMLADSKISESVRAKTLLPLILGDK